MNLGEDFIQVDGEVDWQREEDCCKTPAGKLKPTLSVKVDIAGGGTELTIDIAADHKCGINWVMLNVTLVAEGGGSWHLRGFTAGKRKLKFGPAERRQLPEPIGESITVWADAVSKCGTFSGPENIVIRRF